MPPFNTLDTWSMRTQWQEKKPKAKCFLVGEGANTEFWYLEALATRLAKEGKPELIELKPVERTGKEKNQSAPRKLIEQAKKIRENSDGIDEFDADTDRIIVFFDADIYKNNKKTYKSDLEQLSEVAQVAVTYPSFELFLLLHAPDALKERIKPNETAILKNCYAPGSRRRFIEKLASDALGMNVKRNRGVRELANRFEYALEAEKHLNQDPACAIGRLTSNVAASIQRVMEEGTP